MFEKLRSIYRVVQPPSVAFDPQLFAIKLEALLKSHSTSRSTPQEARKGSEIGETHLWTVSEAAYWTGIPDRWFEVALNGTISTVSQRKLAALQAVFKIDQQYWERPPLFRDPDYPRYCSIYLAYLFDHYRKPSDVAYTEAEITTATAPRLGDDFIARIRQATIYLTYAQRQAICDAFDVKSDFWSHRLGSRNWHNDDLVPNDDVASRIVCIRGITGTERQDSQIMAQLAEIINKAERRFDTQEWREHREAHDDEEIAAQLQRWTRGEGDDPVQERITCKLIGAFDMTDVEADRLPVKLLAMRGYYTAVPPLLAQLAIEKSLEGRINIVQALGELRHKAALPALYRSQIGGVEDALERRSLARAIDQIERKGESNTPMVALG